jgi:hypothetical protein
VVLLYKYERVPTEAGGVVVDDDVGEVVAKG